MADKDLDRLAAEELLHEAGRGKERASTMGTYGWKKRQVSTNKVFLKNTLRGVISGNRHQSSSRVEKHHKDRSKRTGSNIHSEDESEGHKLSHRPHHHRLERTFQDEPKYGQFSRSNTTNLPSDESQNQRNSRSSNTRIQNHDDRTNSHERGKTKSGHSPKSDIRNLPSSESHCQRTSMSSSTCNTCTKVNNHNNGTISHKSGKIKSGHSSHTGYH